MKHYLATVFTFFILFTSYSQIFLDPNEVCVNDEFTYDDLHPAITNLVTDDVIYFHEMTYDWTGTSTYPLNRIEVSCTLDGKGPDLTTLDMYPYGFTTPRVLLIDGSGPIVVTIKDVTITGDAKITIGSDAHVIFDNVVFNNTQYNQVTGSGAASNWSHVEFVNCTFNKTGSNGQNINMNGDLTMDNCTVNGVHVIAYNNDVVVLNSRFIDSKLTGSSSGLSAGRHNTNTISNVVFENSDIQLQNKAEHTLVQDVVFDALVTEFDYRIYGDTCEIYDVEGDFASSFNVNVGEVTKMARFIIKDVHFELLTDSYFNVAAKDSSYVQMENIVIDQSNATNFGFYIVHGLGSIGTAENCSIVGGGRGFYTTRPDFSFINCHAKNCSNKGFEIKGGLLDRCSAVGCDYGVYVNNPTGDVTVSNSIIADGTNDGVFMTNTSTGASFEFDCVNNTIVNNGGYGANFEQSSGSTIRPTLYFANNISVDNNDNDLNISSNIRNSGQYEIWNNLFSDHWTDYTGYKHRDCRWVVAGSYHDPYFDVDAVNRMDQLRPQANSVAIDNGLDIGWDSFDYSFDGSNSREIGNGVDIGAHEFNDLLPHLKLSTPEPFWEGAEDGQVIDVELVNGKFDSTLDVSNWSLLGITPVSLGGFIDLGSVTFIDSTHAKVTLSGNTPYLVWPLKKNQYNLGLEANSSELADGSEAVQGKGVLYLKAGEPIPDLIESYRFHDQLNMMFTYNGAKDIMATTDPIENILEFNIEVPTTGEYDLEWKYKSPVSTGIDRIYEDEDLVLVEHESALTIGAWATQTMNVHLTEGFHRMKFYYIDADIEIEWIEFKGLITAQEELRNADLHVYPVPASDILHLDASTTVLSYELRALDGKILRVGDTQDVEMANLPKGVYLLSVVTDDGTLSKKILK